ncbi:MAG TPA: PilZ domain-containing protein [Pyrinomonadaceae bacterium]|nr:PilZ domain-containing protein [Pyrinomonadaceae bacterium]
MKRGRRKVVRVQTSLPVEWGLTRKYEHHGKITSISHGGCLLQTEAVQPLFEKTIYIRFPLPDRDWWEAQGRVLYYLRDVGFGVEFSDLADEDAATLRRLMQHYREHTPDARAD